MMNLVSFDEEAGKSDFVRLVRLLQPRSQNRWRACCLRAAYSIASELPAAPSGLVLVNQAMIQSTKHPPTLIATRRMTLIEIKT